jgi:ABC-type lipoprotein release transport system permease subunit
VGIFAGTFSVAVMQGAINQRLDAALDNELSHIQITHKEFRANNDLLFTIKDRSQLENELFDEPGIRAVTSRKVVIGMANTATKSFGVQILGIDPAMEREVFTLYKTIIPGTGTYLDETERQNMAYIGEDLAKELNIIRYIITEQSMDSLLVADVPESTVEKLSQFIGKRFKNEKLFKKEMKKVLSAKEQLSFAGTISEAAKSYRERAKLTLTFLDKDNNQTGAVFRIAGLYDIANNMYETTQVFVRESDLARLSGINESECHQLVLRINDVELTDEITETLRLKYPELEIMNWKEIQPDLAMIAEMTQMMYGILMLVILAALAFGIVNTMLMVVLERTKELGMLLAIGMNKKKVFRMIMTESLFLSLTGGVFGMIVGKLIIAITATNGIRFSAYEEGFEAMGYSSHIYPTLEMGFFITVTILVIITGILSSIYPALKALKLDPADALRTE